MGQACQVIITQDHRHVFLAFVKQSIWKLQGKALLAMEQIKMAARGTVHNTGVAMATAMGGRVELRKLWVRKRR